MMYRTNINKRRHHPWNHYSIARLLFLPANNSYWDTMETNLSLSIAMRKLHDMYSFVSAAKFSFSSCEFLLLKFPQCEHHSEQSKPYFELFTFVKLQILKLEYFDSFCLYFHWEWVFQLCLASFINWKKQIFHWVQF